MSKLSVIKAGLETSIKVAKKCAPTVLKILGVGMVVGAVADAAIQSPKAQEALEKAQEEKGEEELTIKEKVKTVAPVMWHVPVLAIGGVGGIMAGYKIDISRLMKKNKELVSDAVMLKSAYDMIADEKKGYVEATKEIVGEEKEKEIENRVKENYVKSIPVENIPDKPEGHDDYVLYAEATSRQLFWGPKPGKQYEPPMFVEKAVLRVNQLIQKEGECGLGEYVEALGGEKSPLMDNYIIKPAFLGTQVEANVYQSTIVNGQPCILISLNTDPYVPEYNAYSSWR